VLVVPAMLGALALAPAAFAHGYSSGKAGKSAFKGEQRILVVLATWGPESFTPDEVRRVVFEETDAFMRASSFGQTWLTGDVTPWLPAFNRRLRCETSLIRDVSRIAAQEAGFDPVRYDRFIYVFPRTSCPFAGMASGENVWLNGSLSRKLVAHELGHTYGLSHSNTWECVRGSCTSVEYGDPYDTMGSGSGDFNAYEKFRIGWMTNVARPTAAGDFAVSALELPSTGPQALVVTSARGEYWVDYRSIGPPGPFGGSTLPPGVLVHAGPNMAAAPETVVFAQDNLLLPDPAGLGRPVFFAGETFEERGAFRVTVLEENGSEAKLRFAWTDVTRPRPPRIVGLPARMRPGGTLEVGWNDAVELGSGLAAYEVSLDRAKPRRIGVQFGITPLARFRRPGLGSHTLSVVAVDRAGNRSAPAVRRFIVAAAKKR
jgi:hypothetical protein